MYMCMQISYARIDFESYIQCPFAFKGLNNLESESKCLHVQLISWLLTQHICNFSIPEGHGEGGER